MFILTLLTTIEEKINQNIYFPLLVVMGDNSNKYHSPLSSMFKSIQFQNLLHRSVEQGVKGLR